MLILALDTTSNAGSCALVRNDDLVREDASDSSQSHASKLPAELATLLRRAGVTLQDIDALAVGIGPGSFTGLRVGIATMQGLASALRLPLFGVSALDSLAFMANFRSGMSTRPDAPTTIGSTERPDAAGAAAAVRVATWIDAWRGEVYAATYKDGVEIEPATVARPAELLAKLWGGPATFTGDGAALHRDAISAALGQDARFTEPVTPLLAGAMAALAKEDFRKGLRPLPHAIRPLYVRRSDAELARGRS